MSGGRLNLELTGDAGVSYAAELEVGAERWRGALDVAADGKVNFRPWPAAEPPAWLCQATIAIVRAEWRNRQGPDPAPWPRRLKRWRKAPDPPPG